MNQRSPVLYQFVCQNNFKFQIPFWVFFLFLRNYRYLSQKTYQPLMYNIFWEIWIFGSCVKLLHPVALTKRCQHKWCARLAHLTGSRPSQPQPPLSFLLHSLQFSHNPSTESTPTSFWVQNRYMYSCTFAFIRECNLMVPLCLQDRKSVV